MFPLFVRPLKSIQSKFSSQPLQFLLLALPLLAAIGASTACSTFSSASSSEPSSSNTGAQQASSGKISIAISPAIATVAPGHSLQFTATLSGSSNSAVTWSTSSGTISPTGLFTAPATAAVTTITVSATSAASQENVASATVTVTSAPAISTAALPAATVGVAYHAVLSASGGGAPYRWGIVSGTLPAGLQLNSSTGALAGIPSSAGTSSFVAQVTDNAGGTVQRNLTLAVSAPQTAACGPPGYNCSRDDFAEIIPSAPPHLGSNRKYYGGHAGAGSIAIDPSYGNRILRVTDGNTDSGAGMSFGTSWSAEANLISSDESLFFVTNEGNTPCLFQFDRNAFQATFHGCRHHSGAGNLQFGYTLADASAFYNYSGNYLYRFVISRSDFGISSDSAFNHGQGYFDPDGPQCLNGQLAAGGVWYVQDTSLSSDDQTFAAEMGPEQDEDPYVVIYNASKGCRWINVKTWQVSSGWNTGLKNPAKISWVSGAGPKIPGGMHNVQLDRSGRYAVLTINNTTLPNKVFWDTETNTVNDTCAECWSHWACDFEACLWSFGPSDKGFQMRDLSILAASNMASLMGTKDTPYVASTVGWSTDEHAAHQNAILGRQMPYLVEVSQDTGAFTVSNVWDGELIGVNWDGTRRTVRFNKTWSSSFAGCPISRQGHFAICSSDYQMYNKNLGFGNGLNQDTCDHKAIAGLGTTGCRHDVLLFELK